MIETQHIPVQQIQKPERSSQTLLEMISQTSQPELLRVLYEGNPPLSTATPERLTYVPIIKEKMLLPHVSIGYFGPHPSDLPDFIGGITSQLENASMHEFLLTEGEVGAEPLSHEETRIMRRKEVLEGAEVLGNTVSVLSHNGEFLPDGDVLSHLKIATQLVKQTIQQENLSIIAPGPEIDHPDHVATYIAVKNALTELAHDGYFRDKDLPALYVTDPEYGYGSGGNWAREKILEIIPRYEYLYDNQLFVSPTFIVDISKGMQKATAALLMHDTQMKGKDYLWKIPMLKRVRGQQIERKWGESLRQIILPDITQQKNLLAHYLPGETMFALTSQESLTRPTW